MKGEILVIMLRKEAGAGTVSGSQNIQSPEQKHRVSILIHKQALEVRNSHNQRTNKDPLEEGMAAHSSNLACRIPRDTGAWWATVHGVAECRTRLSE